MNVIWGETKQRNPLPIVNIFEFTKKLKFETTTHCKCGKKRRDKCKVTATAYFGDLLSITGDHCHENVPGKPEACQHVEKIKKVVSSSQNLLNTLVIDIELQLID